MDAFLDRFYEEVDDHLADPHTTKRLTKAKKYRDLYEVQKRIWGRLLNITGAESLLGRAEADIEIEADRRFYPLPPGFRHFVGFEKRLSGDPDQIQGDAGTLPAYSADAGLQIVTSQQSFRVQPVPNAVDAGTWTMIYLRGPVLLHNATGTRVYDPQEDVTIAAGSYVLSVPVAGTHRITEAGLFTAAMAGETVTFASPVNGTSTVEGASRTITAATEDYIEFATVTGLANDDTFTVDADWSWMLSGTPATDCGEKVLKADYYNACLLRVYSATKYAPITKEVLDYYEDASGWAFKLRDHWDDIPTGTVKYEICAALPEGEDGIYALDVAIMNASRRTHYRRRAALRLERYELWRACLAWMNTTMDRAPTRTRPVRWDVVDPYEMGVS